MALLSSILYQHVTALYAMKAMLLAAGRGERMESLTATMPKPLLSLGPETLIERQLRRLALAGIREVVINIARFGEQIRAALGDGRRFALDIRWSDEGDLPLETAGGIVRALPMLAGEPFLVVNADVVTDFDFSSLLPLAARHTGNPDGLLGTLVLVPNPPHHAEGDFGVDSEGFVAASGARLTYAGISVLHPDLFADSGPGRAALRPLLDVAVSARRLAALRWDGLWIDVGTPARLEHARRVLQQQQQQQ